MLALQANAVQPHIPSWSRTAIHDTVAAIARQTPYRRDLGGTLFSRIMEWLGDAYTRLVETLAGLPHGRVVATITAAIVVLLVLGRIVYAARLRAALLETAEGGRVRLTSTTDPWRDAEQLATNGQFTEAAHALYRATLALLSARGLVRVHASKTSGDYARELRRRGSPAYAAFRRFGARYDRIIYGTGECGPVEYAGLLDDARALAPATERAA